LVGAGTYTVTYNYLTKKLTITKDSGVFVLKFGTGTNVLKSASSLLGFSAVDTGSAIAQTSNNTTTPAVFSHLFTRVNNDQLPTYTVYSDKRVVQYFFNGAMLNKLSIEMKAKEYIKADVDFTALKLDSVGTELAPTFSSLSPFVFSQAVVTVAGSPSCNYDSIKIDIDNNVKADHVICTEIYAKKIWSEGFKVNVAMDMYFEDVTEYNKFLSGTSTSLNIKLTSGEAIAGVTPTQYYSIEFDLPDLQYTAAPLPSPSGVYKIAFTTVSFCKVAGGCTLKTTLVNTKSTTY
jgi:hypothetical protein